MTIAKLSFVSKVIASATAASRISVDTSRCVRFARMNSSSHRLLYLQSLRSPKPGAMMSRCRFCSDFTLAQPTIAFSSTFPRIRNSFRDLISKYSLFLRPGKWSRSSAAENMSLQAAGRITKSCPCSRCSMNRILSALSNEDVVEIHPVGCRLYLLRWYGVSSSSRWREYARSVWLLETHTLALRNKNIYQASL